MEYLTLDIKSTISNAIQDALKNSIGSLFKWAANGIINYSYIVCLLVCLIAILLYVSGQRKAGKYVSISFVVYFTLQALRRFVK